MIRATGLVTRTVMVILPAMIDKAPHTLLYVDFILLRRISEVTQCALGILSTVRGMKVFLGTALSFGVARVWH